jgi:gluconate kinase
VASYLITGDAGSGKSTVARALARRGYLAHNTDDMPDVTRLEDHHGRPVEWPEGPVDWSKYAWNWQESALRKLLAGTGTVFVAAIVSNQEKFYSLFEAIFVLVVDPSTLQHRLQSRTEHDYGKHPDELAGILSYHATLERDLLSAPRSVAIEATRPLNLVVDEIVAQTRPGMARAPDALLAQNCAVLGPSPLARAPGRQNRPPQEPARGQSRPSSGRRDHRAA